MITLHHLNNSRSQRILWLLEELELPYEIKRYERNKLTMLAPAELKKVHPLGRSPVITDGDKTLAESGAIIEYLLDTYGKGRLRPAPATPEELRYKFWLHFAEGSLMPPLLISLIFHKIETTPMPFFAKPIIKAVSVTLNASYLGPTMKTNFEYIENELSKSAWFAGNEFTAADIQMSFPMEGGNARAGLLGPKGLAFLEKIHSRPAYKHALEKGGEFKIM
jgi:glutathione S-transferase